jgi:non-ribosomal peptide synthetase component F
MGVGPDILVGLHLERSIELIAAMLGILKAGGAYVPLDPASSPDSRRFIVDDAHLSIIVTSRSLSAGLLTSGVEFAYIEEVDGESVDNPRPVAEPDNLAYVVYGSIHQTAGVHHACERRRLFDASEIWFRFDRDDVWTLSRPFGRDLPSGTWVRSTAAGWLRCRTGSVGPGCSSTCLRGNV